LAKRRTYLDYASSTPIDEALYRRMPRIPAHVLAVNPSALHKEGVQLRRYLDDARTRVASVLDAHADEIIFTSGATESDNLAIAGTLNQWMTNGIDPNEIIVFSSELEHASVSETIEQFSQKGVQHNIFPIEEGIINPKHIIIPETAKAVFVTVLYASNEIGTVQPIADIAKRLRKLKKERPELVTAFHTDATQAPAHLPLRIPKLGVDLMTLGATKLYCRKGAGVLYKKRSLKFRPIMNGGGQERGLRPGTEPVQLIHEFSHALEHAAKIQEEETKRVKELQTYFESELKNHFHRFKITAEKLLRSPHITHVGMPDFDSELMVLELDARGIAVSSKSACKNEEGSVSPIVEKLYGRGWGAVRFSFGRETTMRQLQRIIRAIDAILRKYSNIKAK
jgi:cysteine desulfurase